MQRKEARQLDQAAAINAGTLAILAMPALNNKDAGKTAYIALWHLAGGCEGKVETTKAKWAAMCNRSDRCVGRWLDVLGEEGDGVGVVHVHESRRGQLCLHVYDPRGTAQDVRRVDADPQGEFEFTAEADAAVDADVVLDGVVIDEGVRLDDSEDAHRFGSVASDNQGRFGTADILHAADRFGSMPPPAATAAAEPAVMVPQPPKTGGHGTTAAEKPAVVAPQPPLRLASREEFGEFGKEEIEPRAQSSETQGSESTVNPRENSQLLAPQKKQSGGRGTTAAGSRAANAEAVAVQRSIERRQQQRRDAGQCEPVVAAAGGDLAELGRSAVDGSYAALQAKNRERLIRLILEKVNSWPSLPGKGNLRAEPARKVALAVASGQFPEPELERIFTYLAKRKPDVPWQMFVSCCQTKFKELKIAWDPRQEG